MSSTTNMVMSADLDFSLCAMCIQQCTLFIECIFIANIIARARYITLLLLLYILARFSTGEVGKKHDDDKKQNRTQAEKGKSSQSGSEIDRKKTD